MNGGIRNKDDSLSEHPATGVQERGQAPQVISPVLMPSVAPAVSAPSSSGETQSEGGKVAGNETASASPSSQDTKTSASPSDPCKPSAASSPSSDDQWIKIMGILVPAIVAIGLGIGGFCVTIHVNSDKRVDRSRKRDDETN
ncbi:unnamed protein product [Sympodiomycopsis kandeliae]